MLRTEAESSVNAASKVAALEDIVIQSTLNDLSSDELARAIMQQFNSRVRPGESAFSDSWVRGEVVPRGQFVLGHCNEVPELKLYTGYPIARALNAAPSVKAEIIRNVKISDPLYGAHGSFVLNVPVGKYAKAWTGNQPLLFGPGVHVIHDTNFRFDPEHGFVSQNEHFISHGNYKILRIPVGKIATITLNNVPQLLEGRSEPYFYNTPYFSLIMKSEQEYYHSAAERLIQHGPIKRVMPQTSEVAISYDKGQLHVIRPGVTIIDSPTHYVQPEFVSTALRTLQFPSEETKEARRAENAKASTDEVNYEIFTTKDSLKVGVKIMVAYQIEDPEKALRSLGNLKGIMDHIENCANVDMGKAVQQCSSQEFLASYQNKPSLKGKEESADAVPPLKHFQDSVRDMLAHDLSDYGIKLVRFNIETPKIINPTIASEMEKQSILAATANAKQSTLGQEYEIQTQQARREAETKNIGLQQANQAKLSSAEADLEASKKRAEAIVVEAEAQRKARAMLGTQYQEHPELLQLELAKLQAEMFKSAQIYVTPEQMQSMMQSMMGLQTLPMGYAQQPFAMFGASAQQRRAAAANVVQLPAQAQLPDQHEAPRAGLGGGKS